jgi:hypothetical protein
VEYLILHAMPIDPVSGMLTHLCPMSVRFFYTSGAPYCEARMRWKASKPRIRFSSFMSPHEGVE